jgi:hypothetical protein
MIRKRIVRAGLAIAGATGLALGFASPALAGATVSTTGASLMCNVYRTDALHGYADCWLSDTLADSKQVYAQSANSSADGNGRWTNSGGSGTTLYFRAGITGNSAHWTWSYRACRQVNLGSDNCSGWTSVSF